MQLIGFALILCISKVCLFTSFPKVFRSRGHLISFDDLSAMFICISLTLTDRHLHDHARLSLPGFPLNPPSVQGCRRV